MSELDTEPILEDLVPQEATAEGEADDVEAVEHVQKAAEGEGEADEPVQGEDGGDGEDGGEEKVAANPERTVDDALLELGVSGEDGLLGGVVSKEEDDNEEPGVKEIKAIPFRVPKKLRDDVFKSGIDFTSEEEAERRKKRAARFGIEEFDPLSKFEIDGSELSKRKERSERFGGSVKLGVNDMELEGLEEKKKDVQPSAERRLEVVHMYGTDNMSTRNILSYFGDYGPSHVEWINDSSCNIVFGDEFSAKRALLGLSVPIVSEAEEFEKNFPEESQSLKQSDIELYAWRRAIKNSRKYVVCCVYVRDRGKGARRGEDSDRERGGEREGGAGGEREGGGLLCCIVDSVVG